jgi:hypothetical protein
MLMQMIITSSTRGILKIGRHSRLRALASPLAAMAALAAVSCAPKGPLTPCECDGKPLRAGLPYADLRPLMDHWDPSKKPRNLKRPAEFAKYSYPYAIASVKAYDASPEEAFIHFPVGEVWDPYEKCHYTEECIGFAAKSWLRKKPGGTRELVIAFRGTQFTQWSDWRYANFVPISQACCHNQYKAALFYAKSVVTSAGADRSGIRVILTGHSLGGGLAEYCQRFIQNSEAVTFDPSPNQGVLYALGRRETRKDAVRVYERGEILAFFRYIGSPDIKRECSPEGEGVRAIWLDFYNSDPLSAHSIHDLAMSLVKVADLNGDAGAKSVHDQMKRDWCEGIIHSGHVDFSKSSTRNSGRSGSFKATHH